MYEKNDLINGILMVNVSHYMGDGAVIRGSGMGEGGEIITVWLLFKKNK